MIRKGLLVCGIVSSLLYVAMNVFVPMRYEGYSSASQTVSELSAIGAPTRPLWVLLGVAYTVLVAAFGWGVWASARRNRPLRVVGGLLVAYGVIGLAWPPMHLREVLAAETNADRHHAHRLRDGDRSPHAARDWIRGRGIRKTVPPLLHRDPGDPGRVWRLDRTRMRHGSQANLPTPWIGVWERINIGVFLLWVVVLATMLLSARDTAPVAGRQGSRAA